MDKPDVDYFLIKRALTGIDNECGDTGIGIFEESRYFIAHIDALGHGDKAYEAAVSAEEYLNANHDQDLIGVMNGLHEHLRGTRGAVASLCRLYLKEGTIEHVGIGNITARIYGHNPTTFVSRDGALGYSHVTPRVQKSYFGHGDVLVLTSDGVEEHYRLEEYPDLLFGNAEEIAKKNNKKPRKR